MGFELVFTQPLNERIHAGIVTSLSNEVQFCWELIITMLYNVI